MHKGDHGSTFAGGLVTTSVAHHVVQRIAQPEFLGEVQAKGKLLKEMLEELNSPHVVEVRGRGLMVGVELNIEATSVINAAYEEGLLLVNAGPSVLRFVPPLVISEAEIQRAVETVGRILRAV
jgi:acetylornithine/succinyldiaminopimelate/putrescine aminotransferase